MSRWLQILRDDTVRHLTISIGPLRDIMHEVLRCLRCFGLKRAAEIEVSNPNQQQEKREITAAGTSTATRRRRRIRKRRRRRRRGRRTATTTTTTATTTTEKNRQKTSNNFFIGVGTITIIIKIIKEKGKAAVVFHNMRCGRWRSQHPPSSFKIFKVHCFCCTLAAITGATTVKKTLQKSKAKELQGQNIDKKNLQKSAKRKNERRTPETIQFNTTKPRKIKIPAKTEPCAIHKIRC